MPAEGRGLGSRGTRKGGRDRGDWRKPTSPDFGSEIPDGVACGSEASARPPRGGAGGTGAGGTTAASVAGSEARGGVREDVRFPGGRPQSGRERRTGRTARPRVCERMISNESPVREIRTLGSMSGERKRSRSGVRGTGGMALDAGIRAPSTARPARLFSTLRYAPPHHLRRLSPLLQSHWALLRPIAMPPLQGRVPSGLRIVSISGPARMPVRCARAATETENLSSGAGPKPTTRCCATPLFPAAAIYRP